MGYTPDDQNLRGFVDYYNRTHLWIDGHSLPVGEYMFGRLRFTNNGRIILDYSILEVFRGNLYCKLKVVLRKYICIRKLVFSSISYCLRSFYSELIDYSRKQYSPFPGFYTTISWHGLGWNESGFRDQVYIY